ncbi:hypothetical protein SAMN05216496_2026 [Pseudomonas sp. Z003-0.4C(8344-21)]|uniref:hypothetical protein n=1 Tax=Pseudomonas sp. Z003-0.4C(8344-21) TaxID=1855380 RepID=UPI00087C69B9|nr:hypothetical protein [Pseudomonas sp. Z003-0.4C(8344-21)]SDS62864.1 hypothetical protein SAMN05216496_2026 [Pseudomonas sp. Z003-0.4C(8344-21)]
MSSPIIIPLSRLSLDPQQRHAQLRDYFCDKDAVANRDADSWVLNLGWSDDPYRYVDPQLDIGLTWWGGDLRYQDMALARKRNGRVLLSLNDTWTLESWSEWVCKNPQHGDITVLHVDDHKDLGTPRLFERTDGWIDPIEGRAVNIQQPSTVTSAIMSGSLGMGSFLTPFLHYAPSTDVRHLCQGPKCVGTVDSEIKLESLADTLLSPSERRPGISLVSDQKGVGRGRYRFTDDLDDWLEGLEGGDTSILLHIDMDYFCNRYDGDSDSVDHPGPLNDPLPSVLNRIDELTRALNRGSLVSRLADVVIAFSPGFFPAEFWAQSCDRLLLGLGEQCHGSIAE